LKLQKQQTRQHGKKEYHKFVVVLPSKTIQELGWKDSQDLAFSVTSRNLLLIGPISKRK